MILFHASTVKIEKFYVPYGGIHCGGIYSAYEAALRKVRAAIVDCNSIYLHKLEVNPGRIYQSSDCGDCESWRNMIMYCDIYGYNSVQYKNDFEPDCVSSMLLWNPERIKIISTVEIDRDDAEDALNEFYDTIGF